jgi:hypothetical protein
MAPCGLAHGSGTAQRDILTIFLSTPQPNTHVYTATNIKELFVKTRPGLYGINSLVT